MIEVLKNKTTLASALFEEKKKGKNEQKRFYMAVSEMK